MRNPAEFAASTGTLKGVVAHAAGDNSGCRSAMLPDCGPAPLKALHLLAASCDQIIALSLGEIAEVINDGVVVTSSFDDPVPAQNATWHLLHDLRVVVDLALVVGEDGGGDGPKRGARRASAAPPA